MTETIYRRKVKWNKLTDKYQYQAFYEMRENLFKIRHQETANYL